MPKGVYPHTHIKPKTYPTEMVEQVRRMYYDDGRTQVEIAEALGTTQRVIWKLMKNHSMEARVAAKRNQRGDANDYWRGSDVGYSALHKRVEAQRGKPTACWECGEDREAVRYVWANLTGDYENVWDYTRLCPACHMGYDHSRRLVTGALTRPGGRPA